MKPYHTKIVVSFTVSTLFVSGLLLSQSLVENNRLDNRVKAEGIQLPPTLEVPKKEEFNNKEVSKKDVQKTIKLERYQLEVKTVQAYLSQGTKEHLGYLEEDLTTKQLLEYKTLVSNYSSDLRKLIKKTGDLIQVADISKNFKKDASELAKSINEDKFKVELEKLKEEKEKETSKKVVTEVVDTNKELGDSKELPQTVLVSYDVPSLKEQYLTYEPYTAITAKTTPHYRLQQLAKSNKDGYRIYEGAICVALGSAYGTKIGTLYNIKFSDGKKMKAILGDNKADIHTDSKHQYRDSREIYDGLSGNIVEIIFDRNGYNDSNSVNRKINGDYPADVVSIEKIGVAKGFE